MAESSKLCKVVHFHVVDPRRHLLQPRPPDDERELELGERHAGWRALPSDADGVLYRAKASGCNRVVLAGA